MADDKPEEELDPATAEKQRRDRLEQNRISARESRKRKKTMIEELQRTVITLSKENKELNERNEFLRRELVEIGTKHPGLVPIQALMRGGPLAAQEEEGEGILKEGKAVENPQAAAAPVPQAAAGAKDAQQQQLAMMQQMAQMQALASGMGQNPMGLNPALMGMMNMGGMPGQQSQQQQQEAVASNAGQEGQVAAQQQLPVAAPQGDIKTE